MKLTYTTEGRRAFLLDDEGFTVCEVVTIENCGVPAVTAADLVRRVNAAEELLDVLKSVLPLLEASYLDHEGTDTGSEAVIFEGVELVREAIAKAERVTE